MPIAPSNTAAISTIGISFRSSPRVIVDMTDLFGRTFDCQMLLLPRGSQQSHLGKFHRVGSVELQQTAWFQDLRVCVLHIQPIMHGMVPMEQLKMLIWQRRKGNLKTFTDRLNDNFSEKIPNQRQALWSNRSRRASNPRYLSVHRLSIPPP